jgi:hypothetical protein
MNEIQIIQKQLATERAHFTEIAASCALAPAAGTDWVAACTDYFAFAITRFEPVAAERLAATLARGLDADFLQAFTEAARVHFDKLDTLLGRNVPVTEWRALSQIDADSIFAERIRYARVKALIPP